MEEAEAEATKEERRWAPRLSVAPLGRRWGGAPSSVSPSSSFFLYSSSSPPLSQTPNYLHNNASVCRPSSFSVKDWLDRYLHGSSPSDLRSTQTGAAMPVRIHPLGC